MSTRSKGFVAVRAAFHHIFYLARQPIIGLSFTIARLAILPKGARCVPALFVRRECWTLTWFGRLLAILLTATLILFVARSACPFLALTSPVNGEFLVVESWAPAFVFHDAVERFKSGRYQKIIAAGVVEDWDATGGLIECLGEKNLVGFGAPGDKVVAVCSDNVARDRTLHTALAVKRWLQQQNISETSIDVISIGPHARRSRLLFEQALGDEVKVGVIAIEDRRFDQKHWWRSSAGVRIVLGEVIAYVYARLFSW